MFFLEVNQPNMVARPGLAGKKHAGFGSIASNLIGCVNQTADTDKRRGQTHALPMVLMWTRGDTVHNVLIHFAVLSLLFQLTEATPTSHVTVDLSGSGAAPFQHYWKR